MGADNFIVAKVEVTGDIEQGVFRLYHVFARRADDCLSLCIMGASWKDKRMRDQSFLREKGCFIPCPSTKRQGNDQSSNQSNPPHPSRGPLFHRSPVFSPTCPTSYL